MHDIEPREFSTEFINLGHLSGLTGTIRLSGERPDMFTEQIRCSIGTLERLINNFFVPTFGSFVLETPSELLEQSVYFSDVMKMELCGVRLEIRFVLETVYDFDKDDIVSLIRRGLIVLLPVEYARHMGRLYSLIEFGIYLNDAGTDEDLVEGQVSAGRSRFMLE